MAAETQQQAWDAVRAIHVEYEKLPFVTNMEDALKPGAPAVHEGGNRVSRPSRHMRAATWPRDSPKPTWWWKKPTGPPARFTRRWKRTARWRSGMATI